MKIFKQLVLLVIIFFGLGIAFKYVHADAPPELPKCAGGFASDFDVPDGAGGYKPVPTTCGILYLNVFIDLGQYKNTLILLDKEESFGNSLIYSIVANGVTNRASEHEAGDDVFFAVDKKYFNNAGGLSGIFSITTYTDREFGSYTTMYPKNPKEFSAHLHSFLLASDDQLAKDSGSPVINGNIQFPQGGLLSPYEETTHLECDGLNNICSKDITYVPESFLGKSIILTRGKVVYTPSNIGESITYPIYNQQPTTTSNQNQVQTQPAQNPPEHISFWQHFWNWVKSIF
jgi:hypothetical protein